MKKFFKSVNIWQNYRQECGCLIHFARLANTLLKDEEKKVHETIRFLLVTLPNIYRFKKITDTLSNKPFLIWLLTTPPHLKYVATLPCNLSSMACFAYIDVSQRSVATYVRCDVIFNICLIANLPRNLPVKIFFNQLRFDRIMVMSLWPRCFVPPCIIFLTPNIVVVGVCACVSA